MHVINEPDSAGLSCDVQLHSLHLPCFQFRANVYHPNYYLGCDTTLGCPCLSATGIQEFTKHDFKFSVAPNPTNGSIKIIYLLPQNATGIFEITDMQGRVLFTYKLPPWSTLQNFNLSFLSGGVYSCCIKSESQMATTKLIIMH